MYLYIHIYIYLVYHFSFGNKNILILHMITDGVVVYNGRARDKEESRCLLLTKEDRWNAFCAAHINSISGAHSGKGFTLANVSKTYFWHGMTSDIRLWVCF